MRRDNTDQSTDGRFDQTASPDGETTRTGQEQMTASTPMKNTGRRRCLLIGMSIPGALLVAGSVAWACTLHIGTLTVCSPPTAGGSYASSSQCSKISGSGTAQTGLARVSKSGSSKISVKVSGFYSKTYSVTFRVPGSTANCHRFGSSTNTAVRSLLGYTAAGQPKTVSGPAFVVGDGTGAFPTVFAPATSSTGQAQVCIQDEPNVVDGNMLNVSVI